MLAYYSKWKIICFKLIAALLQIPLQLLSLLFQWKSKPLLQCRKILIQDGYRLGDIILLSQALAHLRKVFVNTTIDFISLPGAKELLKDCKWVDNVIEFRAPWAFNSVSINEWIKCIRRIRASRYDAAVDFRGDPRGVFLLFCSAIPLRISFSDFGARPFSSYCFSTPFNARHQMLRSLFMAEKISGISTSKPNKPIWPKPIVPTQSQRYWDNCAGKRIVIHCSSSNRNKQWPANRSSELIRTLFTKHGIYVIIVGVKQEEPFLKEIAIEANCLCRVECPSFTELGHIIAGCDAVVCCDSFVQHVAWAQDKNVVVIYGPGNPLFTAPFSTKSIVVWNDQILFPPYTQWSAKADTASSSVATVTAAVERLLGLV